jgi:hypothetical protein
VVFKGCAFWVEPVRGPYDKAPENPHPCKNGKGAARESFVVRGFKPCHQSAERERLQPPALQVAGLAGRIGNFLFGFKADV